MMSVMWNLRKKIDEHRGRGGNKVSQGARQTKRDS